MGACVWGERERGKRQKPESDGGWAGLAGAVGWETSGNHWHWVDASNISQWMSVDLVMTLLETRLEAQSSSESGRGRIGEKASWEFQLGDRRRQRDSCMQAREKE